MDEIHPEEKDIISFMRPKRVCLCRQVSEEDLVRAIHMGHDTFDKLVEETLATTGCGTCSSQVRVILEREKAKFTLK